MGRFVWPQQFPRMRRAAVLRRRVGWRCCSRVTTADLVRSFSEPAVIAPTSRTGSILLRLSEGMIAEQVCSSLPFIRSRLRQRQRTQQTPAGASSHRIEQWSHVDSNHGPPACEAGALTN